MGEPKSGHPVQHATVIANVLALRRGGLFAVAWSAVLGAVTTPP